MLLTLAGMAIATLIGVYVFAPWLKSDLVYIYTCLSLSKEYVRLFRARTLIVEMFEKSAKKHPNKTFIWFDGESYSYDMVNQQANKVARFAMEAGLKTGDVVAMMMQNSPEFLWTLLGFAKIGVQVALLNTNIRSKSLWHCYSVSGAKILFFGKDLQDAAESIAEDLKAENTEVWMQGSNVPSVYKSMDEAVEKQSSDSVDPSIRNSIRSNDPFIFIYTSGTTGLPKAAIVSHKRSCAGLALFRKGCQMADNDIVYITLPLYHASALLIGALSVASYGTTMVLKKRFSVSQFWNDCRKYNVTVILYIGELIRYLVSKPKQDNDEDHKVRLAVGNGLRPEVWAQFEERFKIKNIMEFYTATEGLGFFLNLDGVVGSVGRLSPVLSAISPMKIVKFDFENEVPFRNADGWCEKVKPGETGLYVCGLKKGVYEFDGYKGKRELNEKKYLRNLFKEGDEYYNSGDLIMVDENYNMFFKDRVGDTFRWKGENVSTTEVATVISEADESIMDVNVYGVEVPGCDGRAGMAAVTLKKREVTPDLLKAMFVTVVEYLPVYARPLFVRFQEEALTTSTFKYIKYNLRKEGFDPNKIKEPLYLFDTNNKTYTNLTVQLFDQIMSGEIKL